MAVGRRRAGMLARAWQKKGGEVVKDSPLTTAAYARLVRSDQAYAAALRLL